jgi:hypothetical protein
VDTIQAQDMAVGLQNHVKATFAGGKVMLKHTISGCRAQTQVVDSDYIPKITTLLCPSKPIPHLIPRITDVPARVSVVHHWCITLQISD